MISERMLKELNRQINEELYSEYIYLAMAADLEVEGFKGMATWLRVQAREEKAHANIIYNYVQERRARVELEAIEKPPPPKTPPSPSSRPPTTTRFTSPGASTTW